MHDEGRRVVRRLVGRLRHVVHWRVVAANRRVGAGALQASKGLQERDARCRVRFECEMREDGVVAVNDPVGAGTLQGLRKAGRRVVCEV